MEDIPQAEQIPFGQRAKRLGLCVLQELVGYDAPDSIQNQRLAARLLEHEMQQELPPTAEPGE
jgi:hypothetical protein